MSLIDTALPESSALSAESLGARVKLHLKTCVGQGLGYNAFDFKSFFFLLCHEHL